MTARPFSLLWRLATLVAGYAGAGLFLFLTFWIGLLWFGVLFGLASLGFFLVAVVIGIPILILTLPLVWTFAARLDRLRVRLLLGVRIPSPYRRSPPGSSRLARFSTLLLDPGL